MALLMIGTPAFALTTLVPEGELERPPNLGQQFGGSPALDGDTLVFGYKHAVPGGELPAAVVFTRADGGWEPQARVIATDFGPAFYKALVTYSSYADGVLVISAYTTDYPPRPSAFVYEGSGADWTHTATLTPDDDDEYFGEFVITDGDTVVVGSRTTSYLFGRSGSDWVHQATLPGLRPGAVQDGVVVLTDGAALAVLQRAGGTWSRTATLALDGNVIGVGAVALDGRTLMAAGRRAAGTPGSLFVFTRSTSGWSGPSEIPFEGNPSRVTLSGDTAIVTTLDNLAGPEVQMHLVTRQGGAWMHERRFPPPDMFTPNPVLDGDTAVVAVPDRNWTFGGVYLYRVREGIGRGMNLYCAADVDGDGEPDATVVTAQHEVRVRRLDESPVSEFLLNEVGDLLGSTLVPDIGPSGSPALATVVRDVPYYAPSYRHGRGEIRDLQGSARLTELTYALGRPAAVMTSVPDVSGNGMPEIVSIGAQFGNTTLFDSLTGDRVRQFSFAGLLEPLSVDLYPDLDGNGRPELGVFGDNITTGNNDLLELRDIDTGSISQRIWLGFGWEQIALARVRDLNGNGADEVAMLRVHPDGRVNVQVRDLRTRATLSSVDFTPGYRPRHLVAVADVNGNGADELVVFGPRRDGANQKAIVRDSRTGEWLRDMFFDRNFPGQDFVSCGDVDGNGADDVALLAYDPVNGRNKVIVKDTATGQRLAHVRFW